MKKLIKSHLIREHITYTGSELRSHWIMDKTGVIGDAIVSFQGAADVSTDRLVDLIDVQEEAPIWSRLMLHFIVEHFGMPLEQAVARQRLLIAVLAEELRRNAKARKLERKGDDLYDGNRKLSVSIAAASPVSSCIHVGLNVDREGTPVPTIGLADYNVDAVRFATKVMRQYVEEHNAMAIACAKVRPIP
jgi:hypothetical protein